MSPAIGRVGSSDGAIAVQGHERGIDIMSARADTIIDVMVGLDPLADLPRSGWLLRGVRPCESIADHSFGVAMVTMLLVDAVRAEGLAIDGERALRMALVHD